MVFSLANMDYSKYLNCSNCKKSGLYCKEHRREVEILLRKREIQKLLKLPSHQSAEYRHGLKGLLNSYDLWNSIC